MVIFLDETPSANPFPVGVLVTLTTFDPSGRSLAAGSGYLQVGGILELNVLGARPYVATFSGSRAGTVAPVSFFGNALVGADTTVVVPGFVSPTLSPAGYAAEFSAQTVRGYTAENATNAPPLAIGLTASLANLDAQNEAVVAGSRPYTAQGNALDSWGADFFGAYLLRYPYEPDAVYLQRILAAFGPRCTLSAIEAAVRAFYLATAVQRGHELQTNLAFDQEGAYDERGGYDVYVAPASPLALQPVVSVWDAQSNPLLAAEYGIAPPQFVISLAFAGLALGWFLDQSYVDLDAFLIDIGSSQLVNTAPDVRLVPLVSFFKAAGTQPLYLITEN